MKSQIQPGFEEIFFLFNSTTSLSIRSGLAVQASDGDVVRGEGSITARDAASCSVISFALQWKYSRDAVSTPYSPLPTSTTFIYTSNILSLFQNISINDAQYSSMALRRYVLEEKVKQFFATCWVMVLHPLNPALPFLWERSIRSSSTKSTPRCSINRWSSLITIAFMAFGEISCNGTQYILDTVPVPLNCHSRLSISGVHFMGPLLRAYITARLVMRKAVGSKMRILAMNFFMLLHHFPFCVEDYLRIIVEQLGPEDVFGNCCYISV